MDDTNSEHTVADIFERLIDIERKASELYAKLSILFPHALEISTFWDELAKDEIIHMKTLQGIYKSLTQKQLLFSNEKQMWINIVKIHGILNSILIDSIRNLDDAYKLANKIEHSELNDVFKFLVSKHVLSGEQGKYLLSNLMQHQNKLTNLGRKFDEILGKQISVQYT